jgi:hypothetical protein
MTTTATPYACDVCGASGVRLYAKSFPGDRNREVTPLYCWEHTSGGDYCASRSWSLRYSRQLLKVFGGGTVHPVIFVPGKDGTDDSFYFVTTVADSQAHWLSLPNHQPPPPPTM